MARAASPAYADPTAQTNAGHGAGAPMRPDTNGKDRSASAQFLLVPVSRCVTTLVTAIVVLVLLDWFIFDSPLMPPVWRPFGPGGSPSDKLLLANNYRDSRVLFLGDSRAHYGIDPAAASLACGCGPGFNGGFNAAEPALTRIMAERLIEKLSPELVVVSVSQWELSDGAEIRSEEAARELVPPWRYSEYGLSAEESDQMKLSLGSVWRLYGYRAHVRAALEGLASRTPSTKDTSRGYQAFTLQSKLREQDFEWRKRQFFRRFSVEGQRRQELRGLLDDLHQKGVLVMVVAPPFHPGFPRRVQPELAAFQEEISGLTAETGAYFEDLTGPQQSGLTASEFKDYAHLTREGAARYSRRIGEAIRLQLQRGGRVPE